MLKQKTPKNSLQSQTNDKRRLYSQNRTNKIFFRKLEIPYEQQKSFRNCSGLQTPFFKRTYAKISSNNCDPQPETRNSNATRDQNFERKKCYRNHSESSGKISIKDFSGSEKIRGKQTSDQFKEPQQICKSRSLQNGDTNKPKDSVKKRGLDDKTRSKRCLHDHSCERVFQQLFSIPISRDNIQVCCPSLWSERCTMCIHQNNERSNWQSKISGFSGLNIFGRSAVSCFKQRVVFKTVKDNYRTFSEPRFCNKFQEVNPNSDSTNRILGSAYRHKRHDLFTSSQESSKHHQNSISNANKQNGHIKGDKSIFGSLQFNKNDCATGPIAYSKSPKATDSEHKTVQKSTLGKLSKTGHSKSNVNSRFEVVDFGVGTKLYKSNLPSTSRHKNCYRFKRFRVGGSFQQSQNTRTLESKTDQLAYQCKRIVSSFPGPKAFGSQFSKCSCTVVDGQYKCRSLCQSPGRHKVNAPVISCNRNVGMVFGKKNLSFSNLHPRPKKSVSRSTFTFKKPIDRMDAKQRSFSTNRRNLRPPTGGSICLEHEPSAETLHLLGSGSKGSGDGCIHNSMGQMSHVCLSSVQPDTESPSQNYSGRGQRHSNCPRMAVQTLVSNLAEPVNRSSSSSPNASILNTSALGQEVSSPSTGSQKFPSSRMAAIRQSLSHQKISKGVSSILLASWRKGTQKQYESAWRSFCGWCSERSCNPFSCSVKTILKYLSYLFYRKGFQYRTINVHRSAVSMTHLPINNCCVGEHPLVSRLMKGIANLRPPVPKYLKTWDVSIVLNYLLKLSPAPSLSLKTLTLKLVMLMAIVKASRANLLHKLDLRFRVFKRDGVIFSIPQLTKTGKQSGPPIDIFFPAFPQDRRLCVVNYLKNYEKKTLEFRKQVQQNTKNQLFISFIEPHQPICTSTISRWLKSVLKSSGIDIHMFQGHSVRGAAVSSARNLGISATEIMKVADWSSESTFTRFYHRPTERSSFGRTILSATQ